MPLRSNSDENGDFHIIQSCLNLYIYQPTFYKNIEESKIFSMTPFISRICIDLS